MCVCRPEASFRCLSLALTHLGWLQDRFSSLTNWIAMQTQRCPTPCHPSTGNARTCHHAWLLKWTCWGLNSGPHAWEARTLWTEPPLQPHFLLFRSPLNLHTIVLVFCHFVLHLFVYTFSTQQQKVFIQDRDSGQLTWIHGMLQGTGVIRYSLNQ